MIARIWRGATRREDRAAYADYVARTGLTGYRSTPGNRGAYILQRDVGDRTEIITLSFWDSRFFIRKTNAISSSAISPFSTSL